MLSRRKATSLSIFSSRILLSARFIWCFSLSAARFLASCASVLTRLAGRSVGVMAWVACVCVLRVFCVLLRVCWVRCLSPTYSSSVAAAVQRAGWAMCVGYIIWFAA